MDTELLLKNTSRSLYLSVQVLPTSVRPAFSIAYLLCRYADTIADTSLLPAPKRLAWIQQFPDLIQHQSPEQIAALAKEVSGKSDNKHEEALIRNLPSCLKQFNYLSEELKTIVLQVVHAVCEGMQIDLSFFPTEPGSVKAFQTQADLAHYCRLMGGKPGLFWSQLIEKTVSLSVARETFFDWGQQIGDALQIVNILRDLPKDLQLGRCYFPLEDLQAVGLEPQDLCKAENSIRFQPIKEKWIRWGLERLTVAKPYLRQIPKSQFGQRAAVAWPVLWTADTLYKVFQSSHLLNPAIRVKIPRSTIYFTMLATPLLWLSNSFFERWLTGKINKIANNG